MTIENEPMGPMTLDQVIEQATDLKLKKRLGRIAGQYGLGKVLSSEVVGIIKSVPADCPSKEWGDYFNQIVKSWGNRPNHHSRAYPVGRKGQDGQTKRRPK